MDIQEESTGALHIQTRKELTLFESIKRKNNLLASENALAPKTALKNLVVV